MAEAKVNTSEEDIRAIFNEFDTDKSGTIDKKEFQLISHALGETLTEEQTDAAIRSIDTDGNGNIDFAEFVNWFNNTEHSQSSGDNAARSALLKARLSARVFKKKATNFLDALSVSPAIPGVATINYAVQIGEPSGAMHVDIKTFDGLDNEETNVKLFLTIHDSASEDDVSRTLELINGALELVPWEMLERKGVFKARSVTVEPYRGGRAIVLAFSSPLNPFEIVREKIGFHVLENASFHGRLNGNVNFGGLFKAGGSTKLKDLFKFHLQLQLRVQKRLLAVLKSKIASMAQRSPPALLATVFGFSLNNLSFEAKFDDFTDVIIASALSAGERNAELFKVYLDTEVHEFTRFRNGLLLAMVERMPRDQMPPPVVALVDNRDTICATLKGLGGLRFAAGTHGIEAEFSGFDLFELLGTKAERETSDKVPEVGSEDGFFRSLLPENISRVM